jgi:hypothetical protein
MGPDEITQFLTSLAVERQVSASTQNQALAPGSAGGLTVNVLTRWRWRVNTAQL